jgi:hypothetical protein
MSETGSDPIADDIAQQMGASAPADLKPSEVNMGGAAATPDAASASGADNDSGTAPPEKKPDQAEKEEGVEPTPEATEEATEITETEGAEEEPQDPEGSPGWRDKLVGSFKLTAERFKKRFKGEVLEEDQEDYEYDKKDYATAIATGVLGVAMTYTGTKAIVDILPFLSQKYFTSKERSNILDTIKEGDYSVEGEEQTQSNVETKKQLIAEKIQASEFLTEGKKKELIEKLNGIADKYTGEYATLEEERNAEFAEALKEAIDSRISNTAMLKETLNTALVASGVATLRVAAYTGVSLYERHKRVQAERKAETRQGGYLQEMVISGFTETIHGLKGGDAETKGGRAMTRIKAATTLMRAASLGGLAAGEIFGDGIQEAINQSIETFESQGLIGGATEHLTEHGAIFLGENFDPNSEVNRVADVAAAETAAAAVAGGSEALEGTELPEGAEDLPEANVEVPTEEIELASFDEEVIKSATVGSDSGHNSIVGLLKSQIASNPEQFGYNGDPSGVDAWASQQALEAARASELIRDGGDTRLTTEAIGKIAVVATTGESGVGIAMIDVDTGEPLDMSAVREAKVFTYEHGSAGVADKLTSSSIEAPGAVGVEHISVDGGSVEFSYDGDVVTGIDVGAEALSEAGAAEVESMLGGNEAFEQNMADMLAEQKTDLADTTARLEAWKRILDTLQENGQGDSAEAMAVRQALQQDLARAMEHAQDSDIINTSPDGPLVALSREAAKFDADVLAGGSETASFDTLTVPGVGEIEFGLDISGNPTINPDTLLQNAAPSLREAAQNILQEDWEANMDSGFESTADAFKADATKLYVLEKALRALESQGQGSSGEALAVRTEMSRLVENLGDKLDQTNDTVQRAVVDSNVILTPHTEDAAAIPSSATAPRPEKDIPAKADIATPRAETAPAPIEPAPEAHADGEPLKNFKGEHGRVRFQYDSEGNVTDAHVPPDFVTSRADMDEAGNLFGMNRDALAAAFENKGWGDESYNEARRVLHQMATAMKQMDIMRDMQAQGLANTAEYAALAERASFEHEAAENMVQKLIPSYESPVLANLGRLEPGDVPAAPDVIQPSGDSHAARMDELAERKEGSGSAAERIPDQREADLATIEEHGTSGDSHDDKIALDEQYLAAETPEEEQAALEKFGRYMVNKAQSEGHPTPQMIVNMGSRMFRLTYDGVDTYTFADENTGISTSFKE